MALFLPYTNGMASAGVAMPAHIIYSSVHGRDGSLQNVVASRYLILCTNFRLPKDQKFLQ